jgi:5'-nucleotidase
MIRPLCCLPVLLCTLVGATSSPAQENYTLTILHTNDTHAHFESQRGGEGGIARQAAVVKQIRATEPNTLLLDGGDRFTGTLFHKYYQGQDNARVMNALGYDAMVLGNHEFDNGLEVLQKFIDAVQFPILASNLVASNADAGNSPALSKLASSAILDIGGEKIGLVGLVTHETPEITINFPGKENLSWRDDYAAVINDETARLTEQGINKIILITHIGLGVDKALAAELNDVDVIVGGHSHTLLANAYTEAGANAYPQIVENAAGRPVYIVQAGEKTRYLGRLDLQFDAAGQVTKAGGDVIYLSPYITPDPEVQTLLNELAKPVNELKNTPVSGSHGTTVSSRSLLSNKDCRAEECAIGNLIADAMRAETGAQIAVQNGGGIRADIDEGPVTVGEVLTVLPFGNTIATLKLSGAGVRAALENGVSKVGGDSGTGRFPQVSGLRYVFDATREPGSRIVSVEVENADGSFSPLETDTLYTLATNNFMRTGGDGYTVFAEDATEAYDFGRPLEEALIDFMLAHNPLEVELEGRVSVEP